MEIKNKYNVGDSVYVLIDRYGNVNSHMGTNGDHITKVQIIGVGAELTDKGAEVRYRISHKGNVIGEDAVYASPEELRKSLKRMADDNYKRILDAIERMDWICTL